MIFHRHSTAYQYQASVSLDLFFNLKIAVWVTDLSFIFKKLFNKFWLGGENYQCFWNGPKHTSAILGYI